MFCNLNEDKPVISLVESNASYATIFLSIDFSFRLLHMINVVGAYGQTLLEDKRHFQTPDRKHATLGTQVQLPGKPLKS